MKGLPTDYVKKDGKVQACNNYDVWEDSRTCMHYFTGMCCCPFDKDCPYGNENKIWVNDGKEAEKHSKECRRIFQRERESWK